jgi:hypothetical protein
MPQMMFWPFMARTMVEGAHCVKVLNYPGKMPLQRHVTTVWIASLNESLTTRPHSQTC